MKAKVKITGEIIEVRKIADSTNGGLYYESKADRVRPASTLEFISESLPKAIIPIRCATRKADNRVIRVLPSDRGYVELKENNEIDAIHFYSKEILTFKPGVTLQMELEGYIARNKDMSLYLHAKKPFKSSTYSSWISGEQIALPKESFVEVTWQSTPVKANITIVVNKG